MVFSHGLFNICSNKLAMSVIILTVIPVFLLSDITTFYLPTSSWRKAFDQLKAMWPHYSYSGVLTSVACQFHDWFKHLIDNSGPVKASLPAVFWTFLTSRRSMEQPPCPRQRCAEAGCVTLDGPQELWFWFGLDSLTGYFFFQLIHLTYCMCLVRSFRKQLQFNTFTMAWYW